MAKKFSLSIESINQAAMDFIESKSGYKIDIDESKNPMIINIIHNSDIGKLNCYITGGQVSFSVQGSRKLQNITTECMNFIIENTSLPSHDKKTFTAKNIPVEDLDIFIEILSERYTISNLEIKDKTKIRNRYQITGDYDATVFIIYYHSGTLLLQGSLTSFYIKLITQVMEFTSTPFEVIEDFFAIQPSTGHVIDDNLNVHIDNLKIVSGTVLESMIKTSITLVNSGIPVHDYGCYTFGILKALDGLISKRILEDAPDFKDYGTYFVENNNRYCFRRNVGIFNDNNDLKKALEKAYDFLNKNRHSTFHPDKKNLESSRILDFDDALNITNETLVIMNRLCTHW